MRGLLMTYELEAASPRLAVSGTGRIELNDEMDAELSFRVTDTSLDPYVRAFQPTLSPFTSAIASGTIRVVGELYNPDALRIDTDVEQVDLRLFDYRLRNAGADPAERRAPGRCRSMRCKLVGDDTELDLAGIGRTCAISRWRCRPTAPRTSPCCRASCADLRSSGRAEVTARITGTAARAGGVGQRAADRTAALRQLSFPHALEDLNGIVTFDASGLRLDGVTARLGGGPVRFGGRIGLSAYQLSEFDVTATGAGHAAAVSRRHALAGRCRPRAAGAGGRAGGQRHRDREERELDARLRHLRRPVQRPHRRRGADCRRSKDRSRRRRRRCASTCG